MAGSGGGECAPDRAGEPLTLELPFTCHSEHTPLPSTHSQELDPTGKFNGAGTGARNIWQWAATRGGQAVPFASCCGPQGFLPQCQCARRASCS